MKQEKLIVFSGPSAVGKSTVEKFLFKNENLKLGFSVSATTRKPRKNEINGKHYHFFTKEKFDECINSGDFLEWNSHFDNKYGTLISEINSIFDEGKNAFLEIEPYGTMQIIKKHKQLGLNLLTIFLLPPSISYLEERIRKRGTETEKQIKDRLLRAEEEISFSKQFHYSVINDDAERAAKEIAKIILDSEK